MNAPGAGQAAMSVGVRWLLCLTPAILVLMMVLPSLGFRHLFVDEAETGARAITILESGLPRTREADGTLSVNAGGLEIEDGFLHRYTPWVQYYAGAAGLAVGDALGLERDASLRLPFITAHAVGASTLQWGLTAIARVHPVVAAAAASAYALHSGRLLLNRTARYHAIVDLLVIVGMVSLAIRARRGGRGAARVGSVVLFALPHTHTLGGSVAAGCLLLTAWLVASAARPDRPPTGPGRLWPGAAGFRDVVIGGLLPLCFGVGTVALLSRPWAQGAWRVGIPHQVHLSLHYTDFTQYALWGAALVGIGLLWRREMTAAAMLAVSMLAACGVITILDITYPFSQFRYYTWLSSFVAGFVVVAASLPSALESDRSPASSTVAGLSIVATFVVAELAFLAGPLHGASVVLNDYLLQANGSPQPLKQAIAHIAADPAGSPVALDYVPQYINWYLPDRAMALLPDPADRTPLNDHMSIWDEPVGFPVWDLHYPEENPGTWHCRARRNCSFVRVPDTTAPDRYRIQWRDGRLGPPMCVVDVWMADPINHSIFTLAGVAAFRGSGHTNRAMVLGHRCDLPLPPAPAPADTP